MQLFCQFERLDTWISAVLVWFRRKIQVSLAPEFSWRRIGANVTDSISGANGIQCATFVIFTAFIWNNKSWIILIFVLINAKTNKNQFGKVSICFYWLKLECVSGVTRWRNRLRRQVPNTGVLGSIPTEDDRYRGNPDIKNLNKVSMCSDTKKRKHGEKKPSKHCSEVKKK